MADGLSISGGAGSVAAALDDLVAAAALLDRVGDDLRAVAGRTAAFAVRPEVAQAALICPVEAFRAETAVGASALGPSGAGVVALGTEAIGLVVRESVATYREADRLATQAVESVRWTAGRAVGVWVTTEGFPIVVSVGLGLGAADLLTDGAVHEGLLTQLYDHPWVTEQLVGATPAVLDGMLTGVLGPHGSDLLGPAGWPSDGFDGFLDALLGLASVGGLLVDSGRFVVRPVREGRARSETGDGPVDTLAELLGEQVYLGSDGHDGLLTVREVRHPDGTRSWVVQIPGTQDWSPVRGTSALDLTSSARLMAHDHSQLLDCVAAALEAAGAGPAEDVMLTGHSLGGIAAASLAADTGFTSRFHVTSVVTAGSPIARIDVPASVTVLSLEHEQDVVPMLDGRRNEDSAAWVTVRRDLAGGDGSVGGSGDFLVAHDAATYADTATLVDGSTDRSVLRWRESMAEFFDPSDQHTTHYVMTRAA